MDQLMMKRPAGAGELFRDTPSDCLIRSFTPGDRENLKQGLLAFTEGDLVSDETLDDWILKMPGVLPEGIFLAFWQNEAVGTATGVLHREEQTGTLHMVSVSSRARGKKLGKSVCSAVLAYLENQGCGWIDLTTDDFRLPAIKIYLDLGFLPIIPTTEMEDRWTKVLGNLGVSGCSAYREKSSELPELTIKGKESSL